MSIDTVREALIKLRAFAKSFDCDYQEECTPGDDDMCQSCKHVCIADGALADLVALSTIDPEAILKAYNRGYKACQTAINMGAEDYLKPPSEDVIGMAQRIESRFHQGHYAEDYNAIAAIITAHDAEVRRECNKERDQYKAWWEGATETHNQIRKLYDDQNARMWAILKRPECPEGLAQRMLKMPEADRDYFLSLAVESTAYADEIRRKCAEERDAYRDAALAYQDLSTCYRIGKVPNEKLFRRLEEAHAIMDKEAGE